MMPTARTARGNHIGLAAVGVVLLAGGLAALAYGEGLFATADEHTDLLDGAETRWVDARGWVWPVVAVIAAVVFLWCLRWLLVQARGNGVGDLQLETDRRRGGTVVGARLLERAVGDEIADYDGVARASGQLAGATSRPELHLVVALRERADLADVRRRIDGEAVVNLCRALEIDRIPVLLTIRLDVAKAA